MSDPLKNPSQQPESYDPRTPEIVSMVEDATASLSPESFMLERAVQGEDSFPGIRLPEMQPFTTSIRAFFDYTGQNYGYTVHTDRRLDIGFTLIETLSGEAYADDLRMCDGNPDVADYEGYKKMFCNLGFESCEVVHTKDCGKDALKRRVMETLVREKTPVIVDNLTECPSGCAVVGYEQGGDVLVGWNYHVFDFSPNPQPQLFRKENWYEEAAYVAFIGKRTGNPALKDLYRQGIATAYHAMTEDGETLRYARFFNDWKRYFTQTEDECMEEAKRTRYIIGYGTPPDSLFDDEELLRQELARTIDPAYCAYSERRYYAKFFIRQAKDFFPEYEQALEEIACCFERISHEHMEQFYEQVKGKPVDRKKLRKPAVRAKMAKLIDLCRAEEERAISLLKQIVTDMGELS